MLVYVMYSDICSRAHGPREADEPNENGRGPLSGKSSERHAEGARPPSRQTYLVDFWTSQPEQVLTFYLFEYN